MKLLVFCLRTGLALTVATIWESEPADERFLTLSNKQVNLQKYKACFTDSLTS